MKSRERFQAVLNHKAVDGVCVDFGSTAVTGIHISCVASLREHFGLEKQLVKAFEPYQMLGLIEDDLKEAMGIDVDGIVPRQTMFGFPNENWKEFRMPWGQEVLVSEHFVTTTNSNGDILIYPEGDATVPPSGRMPKSSYFFDTIVRQEPIDEKKLNVEDNLEEFGPISDEDLRYFKEEVEALSDLERGIIATFGGMAMGDIALVPAPFMKHPKGIRDITEWYMSTAIRQDYVHEIFSRECEIAIANLKKIHAVVGDAIDAVFICGTDFGTQTSSFCSTDTYDSLYAPYYKQINDWIHKNTTWKTFKHSCGAVEPFMSHFIESGFDIINPVQCSATDMEPRNLKEKYGRDLVFWGGGVDTQQTLPFGTPEEVYKEVMERIEIFNKDSGFVFNTTHNIQANTPVENILAMLKAIRDSS